MSVEAYRLTQHAHIPHVNMAVSTCGDDPVSVGTESSGQDVVCSAGEGYRTAEGRVGHGQIPNIDGAIEGG